MTDRERYFRTRARRYYLAKAKEALCAKTCPALGNERPHFTGELRRLGKALDALWALDMIDGVR